MAQPQPSELNQGGSQTMIARFGDTLLTIDRSALPGRWRQPGVGRELAAIVEVTEESFHPQDGGELRADALQVK